MENFGNEVTRGDRGESKKRKQIFLGIAQRKPEKIKTESDLKAWNWLCPMKNRTRELSVIPDRVKIS